MKLVNGLVVGLCLFSAGGASAASPPGYITFTLVGAIDPNGKVPVINGVPGSGVTNLAVPFPIHYLNHGSSYSVTIGSSNSATFAGTCTTAYVLYGTVAGKAKAFGTAKTKPYSCGKETYWAWVFNMPTIPDYIGAATVVSEVFYGTTVVKTATHFIIQ